MRTSKWWMLAAVSAATFMLLLDVTVINVALPDIQRSLHSTFFDLEWVIDAYALTLAAFLLTAGSLADQLGRRRVFLFGLAVFTIASLLCGMAVNPLMLNVSRAVEGVGGAVMYAVTPAMIANDFVGRQRGLAFGISGGVTGLAVAIGPLIGGAITELSWRWIFLLNVPVGVAVAAITLARVAESRDPKPRGIDWSGVVVFSVALNMLVFALIRGEAEGWRTPLIIGLLAGSALLFAEFVLIERAFGERAMFDLRLFANRSFNGLSLATLLDNAALNVAILFQVLYMQLVLGFSAFATGLRYLPLTVVVFLAAAVAGALAARVPARLLVGVGSAALGAGLLLTAGITARSDWTDLLPGMVLAGLGIGLFNPARAYTAVALVPQARAGMSSGISETFQQGGVAVGVAALGSAAHARIEHSFTALIQQAGLTGEQADRLAAMVSSGRLGEVVAAVPAPQRAAVLAAANQSFIDALNLVLVAGGIVALAGAVLGGWLIRGRDMYQPPVPTGEDEPAQLAGTRV